MLAGTEAILWWKEETFMEQDMLGLHAVLL